MAKRSSPFTESTPCFPPEGWGEVSPNPRGTGMAPDHHLTITRRRAPPPCSILHAPGDQARASLSGTQNPPALKTTTQQTKLLSHWGKVLLLVCLWQKTFPRSSPTRSNIHKAFSCSPVASCSLIHQELSIMFSYISKAVILEPSLFSSHEPSFKDFFNWYFVKDLNYHVRDLPPAMNNREDTF